MRFRLKGSEVLFLNVFIQLLGMNNQFVFLSKRYKEVNLINNKLGCMYICRYFDQRYSFKMLKKW